MGTNPGGEVGHLVSNRVRSASTSATNRNFALYVLKSDRTRVFRCGIAERGIPTHEHTAHMEIAFFQQTVYNYGLLRSKDLHYGTSTLKSKVPAETTRLSFVHRRIDRGEGVEHDVDNSAAPKIRQSM